MANLYIEVFQVNSSNNYALDNPQFHESKYSDLGKLYRALVKEYGKCTGKLFNVGDNNKTQQIGWAFEKREYFDDTRRKKAIKNLTPTERDLNTFMCMTQVSVHVKPKEVLITEHFAKF